MPRPFCPKFYSIRPANNRHYITKAGATDDYNSDVQRPRPPQRVCVPCTQLDIYKDPTGPAPPPDDPLNPRSRYCPKFYSDDPSHNRYYSRRKVYLEMCEYWPSRLSEIHRYDKVPWNPIKPKYAPRARPETMRTDERLKTLPKTPVKRYSLKEKQQEMQLFLISRSLQN